MLQVQSSVLAKSSSSDPGKGPKNVESWDFEVLQLDDLQVEKAAAWILSTKQSGCSVAEAAKLTAFVRSVSAGYLPNPYHNKRHALDVLHTVWRLGELMPWGKIYREQDQFALMVAALAHDIGHFGLTNAFLVDVRDELAIYYNDISPLENMHCNKLFCILSSDKTNIFSQLSQEDFKFIRKMVIDSILHTDPTHHGTIVKDLVALYNGNAQTFSGSSDGASKLIDGMSELLSISENKTNVSRTLLHGADLSNPAKPWNASYGWAKAVVEEFFAQGDQERALGIPIGMLNDRTKVSLPNSQLGFIQFMVAPFATAYTRICRNWVDLVSMLATNVGEWGRLHLEEAGMDESIRVQVVRRMQQLSAQKS